MAAAVAEQVDPAEDPLFQKAPRRSIDIVKGTHTNEIVIALCGPIGSPIHLVAEELEKQLAERFEYECTCLKLSSFIEDRAALVDVKIDSSNRFKRVKSLISAGDKLRERYGSGVLAELAIREISVVRNRRKKEDGADSFAPARVCTIIDSVKNQEELDILRLVYRDMLYCVGVGSPPSFREGSLKKEGMSQADIYELIDQDSGEECSYGQTVRETFPQADVFIRVDTPLIDALAGKIARYLNIILDTQVETPTPDEAAMFMAATAAVNSACLSRQVGAAITDAKGEIIAVGWNDVPKASGGLYCATKDPGHADLRCKNVGRGECQSDVWKQRISRWIAEALAKGNLLSNESIDEATAVIVESKVKDLLEFSRAIHAEMHAIIIGAQKTGDRMVNGKLFCTTYPCHQCARHIIMAGIKDVFYIEPYRKSLATSLHTDAISEQEADKEKVRILPFDGISPNRYLELFRMKEDSRKKDGRVAVVNPRDAQLKTAISLESLPVLEGTVVKNLREKELE